MALAIHMRCCCPPDKPVAGDDRRSLTSSQIAALRRDFSTISSRSDFVLASPCIFGPYAILSYTDLGNGSDWATYARRFASGDITRVGLGNDVVAGDKIKMIVFFHGATG